MRDKTCAIEEEVQKIPSLHTFDEFMFKLCGGTCWQECHHGFPLVVMERLKMCIENGGEQHNADPQSTSYIQVSYHFSRM